MILDFFLKTHVFLGEIASKFETFALAYIIECEIIVCI